MTKVYYDSEKTLVNIDKKEQKDKKEKKDKDSTNAQETTFKIKSKKSKKEEIILT